MPLPKSSTVLRHSYTVPAEPEAVLAHLAEPPHYIGLSPLLVEVRDIRTEGETVHYVAVERFMFLGFLRHDNLIAVSLETERDRLPGAGAVHGRVVSPGGVRMEYRFDLAADGSGGTLVTDTLHLHAPLGMLRFAAGQAGAVQLNRGRVLTERMAALGSAPAGA